MRDDMARVIVERPRIPAFNSRKGRAQPLEDLPHHEVWPAGLNQDRPGWMWVGDTLFVLQIDGKYKKQWTRKCPR